MKQVKSKKRVVDHGEVFTSEKEVNAMLDLVRQECDRIDSKFLEPACGNGNFLAEVLFRKLNSVDFKYRHVQIEWERNAVIAVCNIYGVDILEDNAEECRQRLFNIFKERYIALFPQKIKPEVLRSINFLLKRNILLGDALDYTNPQTKQPIIFSEWSAVNGGKLKRRDYMFKFLVQKSHQFSFFNDQGKADAIDEPVKDFPLIHFLNLGDDSTASEL